jgi:hypothetical protein
LNPNVIRWLRILFTRTCFTSIEAKTRSIYEVIHVRVKATDDCEDEVQILATCPLALLA